MKGQTIFHEKFHTFSLTGKRKVMRTMTFDHLVLAGHSGCEATDQRLELDVVSLAEAPVVQVEL